jgi:hypothetical protein
MVLNVSVATILKDMADQTKENAKHLVEETKNKNAGILEYNLATFLYTETK